MAYLGLGKTNEKLHCNRDAIVAIDSALRLNPRLVECYFIKGRCYYKLDQPEDAYSLYQDAINLGFNNTSVYNAHGEALLAMKRYIDALNTFNSVIEIVGDTKEEIACAYCGSGIALHALGRTEEALQFFEKANELDPMIYSKPQYRYTIQDIGEVIKDRLRVNP